MAAEQGIEVDSAGFRRLMREQRERAQADSRAKKLGHADVSAYRDVLDAGGATTFTGYDEVVSESRVVGLLVGGTAVPAAREGDEVELVLDRTPFYAEGGGQLADQGVIRSGTGAEVAVHDVQTPVPGVIVHRGTVTRGEVTRRRRRHRRGRRGPAPRDQPGAHRHPPGAQGVPAGARRDGDPGRLGERARPVPVRLRLARRPCPRR